MILRICIALVFFITINVKAKENLLTGEEISKKYKVVQSLNIPANYDNGMVLTMYAHIYKINVTQCVIVSRLDNESNFGGYESIVYFKKGIMLRSSQQEFASIFLDDDASQSSTSVRPAEKQPETCRVFSHRRSLPARQTVRRMASSAN